MIQYCAPLLSDAAPLARLARETFHETFAHLYNPRDLNAFYDAHKTAEAYERAMEDPNVRINMAVETGVLVGYCKVGLSASFADYPAEGKRLAELKELYVRSTHQGQGIAQHLMDWAFAQVNTADPDEMVLSVWSENHKAQHFYRKYGFDWVADTGFMVGNQRDAEFLFMRPMK